MNEITRIAEILSKNRDSEKKAINNLTDNFSQKVKDIFSEILFLSKEKTEKEIEYLDRKYSQLKDTIELIVKNYIKTVNSSEFLNKSSAKQEKYIQDFLNEYNATIDKDTITVPIRNIILEEVSIDNICIIINIPDLKYQIFGECGTTNDSNFFHPHVSDCNYLCEGDGADAIAEAKNRVDLFSMVEIIKSILKTYNPNDPYIAIEELEGTAIKCPFCGELVEELNTCEICHDEAGSCCIYYQGPNDEIICNYCNDHLNICQNCDRTLMPTDEIICDNCESTFCSDCLKDDLCEFCKKEQEEEEEEDN